jgi:hypothetical protein
MSEHRWFDRCSGSIASTRSGKYTHIGDGHHQPPPAAAHRFGIDGVVEVLGVGAVDGDQRQVAQVLAPGAILRANVGVEPVGFVQHVRRELLRQIVAQDGEARREVGWTEVLQHFHHPSMGGCGALRPARDLDDHMVAVAGAVCVPRGDLHRVPMTRILRLESTGGPLGAPDAADPAGGIARALDQPRNAPAALVHPHGQHFRAVVMHQRGGVGARQHQRCGTVVRQHQDIAIGPSADAARHAFAVARRGEPVRTLDGLAVAHHRGQALRQGIALPVAVDAETLRQARRRQRLGSLRQMLQQEFAARDRLRIPQFLEFEVRVLGPPIVCMAVGAVPRASLTASCHRK